MSRSGRPSAGYRGINACRSHRYTWRDRKEQRLPGETPLRGGTSPIFVRRKWTSARRENPLGGGYGAPHWAVTSTSGTRKHGRTYEDERFKGAAGKQQIALGGNRWIPIGYFLSTA